MLQKVISIFKIKDIRNKVLYILGILAVFRLMASIPIPGVDIERVHKLFSSNSYLGLLNIFSGGAMRNFSLVMLGVGPYITAIIIMQLLTLIYPPLKEMYYEEGEAGRQKFNQYARIFTAPLAAIQGFGFLNFLRARGIYLASSPWILLQDVVLITAGSMLLMWLGELISEKSLGDGVSLIIFAGIVAGWPQSLWNSINLYTPDKLPAYIVFAIMAIVVVVGIVIINEAERRVPVVYAKRVRGMKMYGGFSSYLPIRVNQAGVIPIIFALSVVLFPQFLGQVFLSFGGNIFHSIGNALIGFYNNYWLYGISYFLLVFLFTYFYTMVTFDPKEISQNLQRNGGFIPGIRPGEQTANFLKRIIYRTTFVGALFLGVVAVLPLISRSLTGVNTLSIGGTGILIVVAVALDIVSQIKAQLAVREYE